MYEKLTDVPFVTEDRKPMLACFFCCTRLKQCCQLQRKCVEAEELLAQMLSEDYEHKPFTNQGHFEPVGGFIRTPVENISVGADCQIGSDAIKQELPAVCEEQDDVELQLGPSEENDPEELSNNGPDVEAHHSESESEEEELVMQIKVEEEGISENRTVRETERYDPKKLSSNGPDVEAHHSESESEEEQLVMQIKVEDEKISENRTVWETERAVVAKKPTLKRKLEDTIPAKPTMNVLSDSKTIRRPNTRF
ncbi:hypothetical protein PYW07_012625 [Mythimna separata]|uniref:Uncharacterized protein n=1 Tax=Mythimna separata TaxID=271217 RepID=A0AAD7Y8X2_MYTSE|nr:hypothetical protein PYW07_012625 [Mythimna separata]